jgi:hypothetical protein
MPDQCQSKSAAVTDKITNKPANPIALETPVFSLVTAFNPVALKVHLILFIHPSNWI